MYIIQFMIYISPDKSILTKRTGPISSSCLVPINSCPLNYYTNTKLIDNWLRSTWPTFLSVTMQTPHIKLKSLNIYMPITETERYMCYSVFLYPSPWMSFMSCKTCCFVLWVARQKLLWYPTNFPLKYNINTS